MQHFENEEIVDSPLMLSTIDARSTSHKPSAPAFRGEESHAILTKSVDSFHFHSQPMRVFISTEFSDNAARAQNPLIQHTNS